jgi:16S rRNA processing protein RimM
MVVMGRVTAPWGVKGAVKVDPWSAERESLCRFPAWWVGKPGELRETAVAECREQGRQLVARFEGCTSREQAEVYRGCEIAISREALPKLAKHEFYQADVIGFEVMNQAGERLGRVAGFLDSGAHGIMRVGHEGGERLLPLAPGVVRRIDVDACRVDVDWGADW